jgi:hypothetical protein
MGTRHRLSDEGPRSPLLESVMEEVLLLKRKRSLMNLAIWRWSSGREWILVLFHFWVMSTFLLFVQLSTRKFTLDRSIQCAVIDIRSGVR